MLRNIFQDVEFIEKTGKFPLREKCNPNRDRYKVTYLKGEFIKENIKMHQEDLLWIDITSFIRTNLDDVAEMLKTRDVVLIQREKVVTEEKKSSAYCAEIFGISSKNKLVIDYYHRSCENLKDSWFADQLSLCNFPTRNKGYLEFPVFCNFHYDPKARSWSDRGKIGIGIVTKEDIEYTMDVYRKELEKYSPSCSMKYAAFFDLFSNKSSRCFYCLILIIIFIITALLLKFY